MLLALTEEGNTFKRLFWEEGHPRLYAENKGYISKKGYFPQEVNNSRSCIKDN